MNNIETAWAVGLDPQDVAEYRSSALPEVWDEEHFYARYVRSDDPRQITFRNADTAIAFTQARELEGLARELSGSHCWVDVDAGTSLRALAAGVSIWEGDTVRCTITLLASSMMAGGSGFALAEQQGPFLVLSGTIEEVEFYTERFYRLSVRDSHGARIDVCVHEDNYVEAKHATFVGTLSAYVAGEHPNFANTNDFELSYGTVMAATEGIATVHYRSSLFTTLHMRPRYFADFWYQMVLTQLGNVELEVDEESRTISGEAKTGARFECDLDNRTFVLYPAQLGHHCVPYVRIDSHSSGFGGGMLVAMEGSFGFLPEGLDFEVPIEPTTYGDACIVSARLLGYRKEALGFSGSDTLVFDVEIGRNRAQLLVSDFFLEKIDKFVPGGWFVGQVMRVDPVDRISSGQLGEAVTAHRIYQLVDQATLKHLELEIEYRDAHGNQTQRRIQPHDLVKAAGGSDLLRAWDKDKHDWRTFLLSRITWCALYNVTFEPKRSDFVAEY